MHKLLISYILRDEGINCHKSDYTNQYHTEISMQLVPKLKGIFDTAVYDGVRAVHNILLVGGANIKYCT